MRFLISGSSGFLGTRLIRVLEAAGHHVVRLRRSSALPAGSPVWDPYGDGVDPAILETADVVVHLSGSPLIGNPHSRKWAQELYRSRIQTTSVMARAIAASNNKPVFIAANGISYYGDHGDDIVTETSTSRGNALLTNITRAWQQATRPASAAGARVIVARTSPVYDKDFSPLRLQRLQFLLGGGGRIGDGTQYFPLISSRDWANAVMYAAVNPELTGPINLCIPQPPTNLQFTTELADRLQRPARLSPPAKVIEYAAGPMAPELLRSLRAVPARLLAAGFTFQDVTVADVLRTALAPAV